MTDGSGRPDRRCRFAREVLPALAAQRPRVLLEALAGPGSAPFLARLWNECAPGLPPPPVGLHAHGAPVAGDTWVVTVRLPLPAGPEDDAWVALVFRRRRGWFRRRMEARCLALGSDSVLRDVGRPDAPVVARNVPPDEASLREAATPTLEA